jgi:hypothetical protein
MGCGYFFETLIPAASLEQKCFKMAADKWVLENESGKLGT